MILSTRWLPVAMIAAVAASAAAAPAAAPVRRLVLDERVIASAENAQLVLGTVTKHPVPLFGEDKPWEPRFDNLYPNVIYDADERVYKCWYSPFIVDPAVARTPRSDRERAPYKSSGKQREMGVCYAVSKDGLRWEKPALGLVEFDGGTANNLVVRGPHGAGVFKDDRESDPSRRYKKFYRPPETPMALAVRFSADGVRWSDQTLCPEAQARADTHNNALWSPEHRKYVGVTRLIDREDKQRLVGRTESEDFIHWSKAVEILRGDKDNQTYAMTTFRYADVYLGIVMVFRPGPSRVHCELAWSPDSLTWHRVNPGTPLIPLSEKPGDYDWGCAFASRPIVKPGGEMRIYYGASNGTHNGWRDGFLALATLRPDGWAGFAPTDAAKPAVVTTKPVAIGAHSLRVTADIAANGAARVFVVDATGRVLAASKPLAGDVTDEAVAWERPDDFDRLRGQSLQLRFELTSATLYAFSL